MTKSEFRRLTIKATDTFGVPSTFIEDIDIDIDNDLWFESPCCQDVISFDDFGTNAELARGICPICGEPLFANAD